jgi:mRNA-degrading endonuclease RelE of RelBE toxin-antitoxin system
VISRVHPSFRRDFAKLPKDVQQRARAAYKRFATDPTHPGLQFKRLQTPLPLWSVRVTDNYRAIGVGAKDDEIVWVFIGTHAEYDRFLANS